MESVEPPRAIGPYKLGRQLGEGAFSRVYLATDMRNGELVAVKAMEKARLAALGVVEHVSQEMTILQSLQHPHCIRLLAVLATRRHLFFAKELVAGGDLADYIALRGPLEPSCARRLMLQLAGALAYCHSLGIFHRDVKPENVLLTPEGDAQLTDFGLSFWAATGPGSGVEGACGTPLFAAPELRARGRVAGAPADVWSLGCLLFFMLVGRPPSVLGRGGGGPATGSPSVVEAVRRSLEQESASLGVDAHALLCSMLDSEPSRRATISQVVRSAWSRGGEAEGSGSYGEGGPETRRWIDQEASASSRLLCSPVAPCASSSVLDAQEGSLLLGHSQAASHLAQNSIIGVPDSPWILTQALPLPAPCLPSARLPASPTRRLNAFDLLASGMSEVQSLLAPGEWAARHHVRLASRSTSAPAALRALCAAAAERGAGVDVGASGAPGTAHCRLRVPPPRNGDARGDLQLTLEAWEILPGQVVLDAVKVCGSQMHFHAFLGQLARAVLPGLEDGDRAAEGGEAGQGELLSPGAASSGGVARRISPKSRTTAFDLMSRAINLQSLLASSDARPPSEQA